MYHSRTFSTFWSMELLHLLNMKAQIEMLCSKEEGNVKSDVGDVNEQRMCHIHVKTEIG